MMYNDKTNILILIYVHTYVCIILLNSLKLIFLNFEGLLMTLTLGCNQLFGSSLNVKFITLEIYF